MIVDLFVPQRHKPGHGISIIVPFADRGGRRAENWRWLSSYYRKHLPGASLIVSGVDDIPFNKSKAVNRGFRYAKGDVIVLMDADCLIDPEVILEAAIDIRAARDCGRRMWLMPYREMYRLTDEFSADILRLAGPFDPEVYWPLHDHLPCDYYENRGNGSMFGHMFGALIQVMPREAFECVGGMDERFAGWGGEDVSFARALDTLYGRHKSLNRPVHHLWHETIQGHSNWTSREWEGQARRTNEHLALRYLMAFNNHDHMRTLVAEGYRHAHGEQE